ncbi:hypothetical protein VTJ49DRAFT_2658 [Mycothermus thermophilus]|uniref:Uncharacterized protein n=1 Tax=Humicola insolens TaxID=85995 RepID=A0ABR3V9Y9_HUMIN
MFFNPFRSRNPPENAWFPVGRASSFPEVGVDKDDEQPKLCSLLNNTHSTDTHSTDSDSSATRTQPALCKVFHVPRTDPTQRTEISLPIDEGAQDLTDQVLVFRYRGKIHAIDHQCPHSSFPLSQGVPFDIEDFGIALSMTHDYLLLIIALLALVPLAILETTCPTKPIALKLSNCSLPEVGWAWGAQLGVGEDGNAPQLCFMPSTVPNVTLVMSKELCEGEGLESFKFNITPAQCRSTRGGVLDRNAFSQFSIDSELDALNLDENNIVWNKIMSDDNFKPFPHAMRAPLRLPYPYDDATSPFVQAWVIQGGNHSANHLGLADDSAFLQGMVEAGLIGREPVWGLNMGSRSVEHPRDGSLVLGGMDGNSFEGALVPFPLRKAGEGAGVKRDCPLQVNLKKLSVGISFGGTNTTTVDFDDDISDTIVCIEPYDDFFRLGPKRMNDIITKAGIELIDRAEYPHLFNVEEGLVYSATTNLSMTMTITLDNGFTVTIPSHELIRPLTGLSRDDGKLMTDPDYNEIAIFRDDPLENRAVFGRVFLSQPGHTPLPQTVDWSNATRLEPSQIQELQRALVKLIQDLPPKRDSSQAQCLALIETVLSASAISPNFYIDSEGMYPIHLAVQKSDALLVKLLLRYGARISVHDRHGDTPLHIATRNDKLSVAKTLLTRSISCAEPSPIDRANAVDARGRPALWYASASGTSNRVFTYLLTLGPGVVDRRCASHPDYPENDEFPTPLWIAASQGRLATARALLGAGANPRVLGPGRSTLLHKANWLGMGTCEKDTNPGLYRGLLAHGADASARDNADRQPLHFAAAAGEVEMCLALLEHRHTETSQAGEKFLPVVDVRDKRGATPLMFAAGAGQGRVVRVLVTRYGADARARDENGNDAFAAACERGYLTTAAFLLGTYPERNLDERNKRGETVLKRARANGHRGVVEWLIELGADAG